MNDIIVTAFRDFWVSIKTVSPSVQFCNFQDIESILEIINVISITKFRNNTVNEEARKVS